MNRLKTNDYVKYMTEQFMNYIDQPKEVREQHKHEKEESKEYLPSRMFGLLPLSLALYKRKLNERRNKKSI